MKSPVIFLHIPNNPTSPPRMDLESKKERIKLIQTISKPVVDEIGNRLAEMGIEFRSSYTLPYIVVLQDVSDYQLSIIKAWKEVNYVAEGNMPLGLIKPVTI